MTPQATITKPVKITLTVFIHIKELIIIDIKSMKDNDKMRKYSCENIHVKKIESLFLVETISVIISLVDNSFDR